MLEFSVIVVSGALAVVAFALLIAGLVASGLALVYVSIAVSVVAMVFLAIGAYQRRGETAPGLALSSPAPAAMPTEDLTPVVRPVSTPAAELDESVTTIPADSGREDVLVVPGRPRYHVAGCRYLSGKDAEVRTRTEALEEGFSPCGVCRPDDALAGVAEAASGPEPEPAQAVTFVAPSGAEDEEEPVAEVAAAAASRKTATKRTATTKAASKAPARKAPAKKTAAKKAPAKKTASRSTGKVVVIPDRGKYHTASCRFVANADATLELTKAQASRQGYEPCGVCKP
jgi:hypothetical protein